MNIRDEKGFTLLEMILALAILVVFMAAMTSLMLTTTKMTSTVTQNNNAKSVNTLLIPHIEQSILENEAVGAIKVKQDDPVYKPVLEIDTNKDAMKLFYFYDKSDQAIYFQAAPTFAPGNKNISVKVASHVTKFELTLSQVQKALRVSVTVKTPDGTKEYANTITLEVD